VSTVTTEGSNCRTKAGMSAAVAVLDAVLVAAAAGMVVDAVLDAAAVVDAAGVGDEVQPASVSAVTAPHDATNASRCLRRGRPRRCRWSRCHRSGCIRPAFRELLDFPPAGPSLLTETP